MVREQIFHGLKNTAELLFRRQTSITSAAAVIILFALASRVLGVIRFRVLAGEFGSDSVELAAFLTAFKIPDIIFNILVLGALATAFIPVISGYLAKREDKEAERIFSVVVSYALLATAIFTVVVFIFAEPIVRLLAPGLSGQPNVVTLTANIIRALMVGQFFLIVSNFVTGMLNSYHRFIISALSPVLYNVGIILGTVLFSAEFGIFGPVVGVIFGAVMHLAIQLPLLGRLGVGFSLSFDRNLPGVREVGRLMAPRAFGLAVAQVDSLVDTALASLVTSVAAQTSIIVYNYAFALQALPAGVFGYAIGVASLPTLAKEFAQENLENFKKTLIASMHQILYIVIPVVAILVVLRVPVVRLVFGAPGFDWDATRLTAYTLAAFSVGIVGQSLIQLLARGFYALHDTKTPVKIAVFSILLNIIASVLFIYYFNNVALLGVAASIAGTINAVLLLYFLAKRVGGLPWGEVLIPSFKMLLAGGLSAIALYTPLKLLDSASYGQLWQHGSVIHTYFGNWAIDTSHTAGLLLLTVISATLGLAVYFLLTYLLGIEEIAVFARLFEKFKSRTFGEKLEETMPPEPISGDPPQHST